MRMKVLAYKDLKLNIFTQPFYMDGERTSTDIIETIRRMCANPDLPARYFEYDLYSLGVFDDKTGSFESCEPEFLVSLGDFKYLAAKKEESIDVQS